MVSLNPPPPKKNKKKQQQQENKLESIDKLSINVLGKKQTR